MKKYTTYKTIQLILLILMAAAAIFLVFRNAEVYHQVATDPTMTLLASILWVLLALSFVFIFLDYTFFFGYKKEYREMEYAVRSDPTSGIANRFSCDMVIEKYLDKPIPADLGCIMFDLTNIQEINKLYGHLQGNMLIRDFSNILRLSSDELCFVGRNGGNKFLAIFEHSTPYDMEKFLERVNQRVHMHNSDIKNNMIEYTYGQAVNEDSSIREITQLIALANERSSSGELHS